MRSYYFILIQVFIYFVRESGDAGRKAAEIKPDTSVEP